MHNAAGPHLSDELDACSQSPTSRDEVVDQHHFVTWRHCPNVHLDFIAAILQLILGRDRLSCGRQPPLERMQQRRHRFAVNGTEAHLEVSSASSVAQI